jgi:chromate reductase, NAD(P)H dehydrogenase (quinone)
VREGDEPFLAAYQDRVFALGAASPGLSGGMQSLIALRQVLAVGCRALVIADQVTIPNAREAFDAEDELKDPRAASQLKLVVRKLLAYVRLLRPGG